MRQNLNHWFRPRFLIWSTELGTDVVGPGDSLVTEKSFHGVVCAIGDTCHALDERGSIYWQVYFWHIENALTSHNFDLDGVSIAQ
jgi:hypothetical protein